MRSYILLFAFILHIQAASVNICETCDCLTQRESTTSNIHVICSFRGEIIQENPFLPNNTITLDLSVSNITSIQPTNILQLDTLQELRLNKNGLKEINVDSFQLPELRRLDLSENELESLHPNLFERTTKLEYLNLANNKFTAASQLRFNLLVNLKEIILNNNDIGSDIQNRSLFDINGYGLPLDIESISISGIGLKDLNNSYFAPVHKLLKKLDISNNSLDRFFIIPENIEYLDVSSNPIEDIPSGTFPLYTPLMYLRVLKLNNLKISKMGPYSLTNMVLFHLELESNTDFKDFSNLTFNRQILRDSYDFLIVNLTLKGSGLSTLDKDLSVLFERVKRLDLQKNPWVCDCRLSWFLRLPIDPDLKEDLRCHSPEHLRNERIFDLREEDFTCSRTWWDVADDGFTIALVSYTVLVLMVFVWVYMFMCQRTRTVNKKDYSYMQ